MNRQNYGKRSNVVIDVCKDHGAWFDAHELGRILDWVRSGGLEQMRRDEKERLRDERRRAAREPQPPPFTSGAPMPDDRGPDLLGALIRLFW
jgi:Zn-finger nucleic acid-binding protein